MRRTTGILLLGLAMGAANAGAQGVVPPPKPAESPSDALDDAVQAEMRKRQVPGLSLAVIQNGEIVKAKGYGVTERGGKSAVTSSTLFQAGSISKPVAAVGALRLVGQGKLELDQDVNARLTTWKVPENEFAREKKVTLRGLLSHTAGLTVHGFPGYAADEPVATLVQVLDGAKPANTQPIRVDIVPGSRWRYSGGGYTVMQQMVIDVTGRPFPQFMHEAVLEPFGMKESTFEQPLPADRARLTASGHNPDRSVVKGRWHIYPEMAAAGLWTTPSDLARFAIGLQQAATDRSATVLSREIARRMLTVEKDGYGLGVGLEGTGTALQFGHGGRDAGFDARLTAFAETGQGAVIMINTNDNSRMVSRIVEVIAREYRWPNRPRPTPSERPLAQVAEAKLIGCTGRYEFANNQMLTIAADRDHLVTLVDGFPDEEFLPESEDRFHSAERDIQITVVKDDGGEIRGISWKQGSQQREIPRIGPLFHSLKPRTDPDPARTEKVVAALRVLAEGGKALADSPLLTSGARADLGGDQSQRELAGLRSVVFLAEQDVSSLRIERHKGAVSRVLHYRLVTDKPDRGILIHLTSDGQITDYDIVDD
jgi:CubicO group peptidase (beta-lactamase class C family)